MVGSSHMQQRKRIATEGVDFDVYAAHQIVPAHAYKRAYEAEVGLHVCICVNMRVKFVGEKKRLSVTHLHVYACVCVCVCKCEYAFGYKYMSNYLHHIQSHSPFWMRSS